MPRFIALVRGINVGGRVVKMERLREIFGDLGFPDVRTYIQSGNVFFDSEEDAAELTKRIEDGLEKALGYSVSVMLRTTAEMRAALAGDPFGKHPLTPETRHFVYFLDAPLEGGIELDEGSEAAGFLLAERRERELYVVQWVRDGRLIEAKPLSGRALKRRITARFFHTSQKILAAAEV